MTLARSSTAAGIIAYLASLANPENKAGMARYGIRTDRAFGVSNAVLRPLARQIGRDHAVGEAASKVAVMPVVRRALVDKQRAFAASGNGAILDGRDIGTVVCPDAPVKLYVTASAEVRASRRYHEILSNGGTADEAQILEDVKRRDARDMGRADSPLRPADDAHLLDTSDMDIETAFRKARAIIDAVRQA